MLEQSIWAIAIFSFFFFLFGRQTFSAPRKGCLGELTASWVGRRRSDHPLSQPQTHLVLLCRGRAECCIFLPWGSCCQPFSSPMLCSGQAPAWGAHGWQVDMGMEQQHCLFLVTHGSATAGTGWLFSERHSPHGPHEVGVCFGGQHEAECLEADTWCSLKPPWWATSHQQEGFEEILVVFSFVLNPPLY